MDAQPALFDVDRTQDTRCPVCGATRPAGEHQAADCEFDRDREPRARRPAACLNAHQPEHAPIPY